MPATGAGMTVLQRITIAAHSIGLAAKSQDLARLIRCRDLIAQDLDNMCRLLHQRGVARCELALLEIKIVLEPDAHMPAEQHRLRHHRELVERDAEGEPG